MPINLINEEEIYISKSSIKYIKKFLKNCAKIFEQINIKEEKKILLLNY